MAEKPAKATTHKAVSEIEVFDAIVAAVAEVRLETERQTRKRLDVTGDLDLGSQEALAVYAIVEQRCGLGELLTAADFINDGPRAQALRDSRVGSHSCLLATEPTTVKGLARTILSKL